MSTPGNIDAHVQQLARRFPALLADAHAAMQKSPSQRRIERVEAAPVRFQCGRCVGLVYGDDRQADALLTQLDEDQLLLQFFHSLADFLLFLGKAGFPALIADERWVPWPLVSLADSEHARGVCGRIAPRDWPWPLARGVVKEGPAADPAALLGRELTAVIRHNTERLAEALEQQYRDRAAPGAVLRAKERPLRVLCLAGRASAYQRYCARDIAAAMSALGVEAHAAMLEITPAVAWDALNEIRQFDPDVVLLNGRGRKSWAKLPAGLPVVSWDQDYCLAPSEDFARDFGARDQLLVMLEDWREDAIRSGVPADRITHVNMGVNTDLYRPAGSADPPDCDVLFVGNYHPFDEYRAVIGFDMQDALTQRVQLRACERLREWALTRDADEPFVLPDIDALLRQSLADLGLRHVMPPERWRQSILYFRYRLAHLLLREIYVSALADFRLCAYGHGWDKVPAVAHGARPPIENGPELRAAVQRAAINVHLHTWTVHHPRLYDTAAAGGFLLVGRVPEAYPLDRVFDPAAEVDTFGSIAELRSKVRYYLDHPEQREARARRAAQRARCDHAMTLRMSRVLEVLNSDVRSNTAAHVDSAERAAVVVC